MTTTRVIVIMAAVRSAHGGPDRAKVLHASPALPPMLALFSTGATAAGEDCNSVGLDETCGPKAARITPDIEVFEQPAQTGTGRAVLEARPALPLHKGDVIVVSPIRRVAHRRSPALQALRGRCADRGAGLEAPMPPYGRLILSREPRHGDPDAEPARWSARGYCNAGARAFRVGNLATSSSARPQQRQERALPDRHRRDRRRRPHRRRGRAPEEAMGINSRSSLRRGGWVSDAGRRRRWRRAPDDAPETVWRASTPPTPHRDRPDVTSRPTFFGPGGGGRRPHHGNCTSSAPRTGWRPRRPFDGSGPAPTSAPRAGRNFARSERHAEAGARPIT